MPVMDRNSSTIAIHTPVTACQLRLWRAVRRPPRRALSGSNRARARLRAFRLRSNQR